MLTQIVLFGILISGSLFGSSIYKKRFEDMLPITCSFIVFALFICGTLGVLKQGLYVVTATSIFLWGYSVIYLLKKGNWKEFQGTFLTPAFCVFTFAYLVLTYTNYGMLASVWDEFSHWADIVKAMVAVDDFGTNPAAHSMFQSYPPGMSLFQYFFQKIYILLNRGELFSEWRMYYAYQLFFLAFLMPFLRELTFEKFSLKKLFGMITAAAVICVGPMLVFDDIYIIVLIDAFLGLITGTGMAMIFWRKKKDWCYDLYIMCNVAILVLAKDAGMLFAVFMAAAYVIDFVFYRDAKITSKILWSVSSICAVFVPKVLWSYNIKADNAYVAFSNSVNFKELLNVITGADKTSYRAEVLRNFFSKIYTEKFEVTVLEFEIPYIIIYGMLVLVSILICLKYKSQNSKENKKRTMVLTLFISETVVYILGLLVTYMFKFSEHEAVELASFDRYMNIILEGMVIFVLMLLVNYVVTHEKSVQLSLILLIAVLSFTPWGMIKRVGLRHNVSNTVNTRVRYVPIIEQIEEIARDRGEVLRVNVIAQESAGYHGLILRYSLRPNLVVGAESIGIPFYEDDIYTVEKTAKEWQLELKETVDCVAIYQLNDYFKEAFSEVFENPEDIHENGVYLVDKSTGKLTLYE